MAHNLKDDKLAFLFEAILSLKDAEECYNFFEDLCTISEIQEMSKRFFAAKLLSENFIYNDISNQTGLSTATISRVNRCLKYGSDGYVVLLERLKNKNE